MKGSPRGHGRKSKEDIKGSPKMTWKEVQRVHGRKSREDMEGSPRRTWKKQFEEECIKISLRKEYALCRPKLSVGISLIATRFRWIWPLSPVGDNTRF